MLRCSQELNEAVDEALSVRRELEDIMGEAVGLSTSIVSGLEDKIKGTDNSDLTVGTCPPGEAISEQANIAIAAADDFLPGIKVAPVKPSKIRVYELAQELNLTSRELLVIIKDLNIKANSHMNMLDEEQVDLIKSYLNNQSQDESDDLDKVSTISRLVPMESFSPGIVFDFLASDDVSREDILSDTPPMDNSVRVTATEDNRLEESITDFNLASIQAAHPYIAVNMLHEKGYSVREIAKLLDKGQGEVSLILKLAQKKKAVI